MVTEAATRHGLYVLLRTGVVPPPPPGEAHNEQWRLITCEVSLEGETDKDAVTRVVREQYEWDLAMSCRYRPESIAQSVCHEEGLSKRQVKAMARVL